jgi:hypothetical protein
LCISIPIHYIRGSIDGLGAMLQAEKSRVLVPMSLDIFNLPNPSSRIMAQRFNKLLTEMSIGKYFCELERGRRVRLTNVSEVNVKTMWDPPHVTTL